MREMLMKVQAGEVTYDGYEWTIAKSDVASLRGAGFAVNVYGSKGKPVALEITAAGEAEIAK